MGDLLTQPIPTIEQAEAILASVLPDDHERFAALVASGVSYSKAAEQSGFSNDWGWQLMRLPRIRARVVELAQDQEARDRAWMDTEWARITNRIRGSELDESQRANVDLQVRVLMSYAKYKGWIKERKEVRQVNINMSQAEAKAMLEQQLQAIPAAARRQIEASIADAKAAVMPGSAKPKRK